MSLVVSCFLLFLAIMTLSANRLQELQNSNADSQIMAQEYESNFQPKKQVGERSAAEEEGLLPSFRSTVVFLGYCAVALICFLAFIGLFNVLSKRNVKKKHNKSKKSKKVAKEFTSDLPETTSTVSSWTDIEERKKNKRLAKVEQRKGRKERQKACQRSFTTEDDQSFFVDMPETSSSLSTEKKGLQVQKNVQIAYPLANRRFKHQQLYSQRECPMAYLKEDNEESTSFRTVSSGSSSYDSAESLQSKADSPLTSLFGMKVFHCNVNQLSMPIAKKLAKLDRDAVIYVYKKNDCGADREATSLVSDNALNLQETVMPVVENDDDKDSVSSLPSRSNHQNTPMTNETMSSSTILFSPYVSTVSSNDKHRQLNEVKQGKDNHRNRLLAGRKQASEAFDLSANYCSEVIYQRVEKKKKKAKCASLPAARRLKSILRRPRSAKSVVARDDDSLLVDDEVSPREEQNEQQHQHGHHRRQTTANSRKRVSFSRKMEVRFINNSSK